MELGLIGQSVGMFAATNVDDIVILALFFSQTTSRRAIVRVIAGQYLGFTAILAASALGTLGAGLLPDSAIRYLGLLPLALGLRAGWRTWRDRAGAGEESEVPTAPSMLAVAGVTFANGGDNIGVYVPVFANTGTGGMVTFTVVSLVLVALWCLTGRYLATRPLIARALAKWGHIALPLVLITIGTLILFD
ncbi:cadmium resistance transporter [Actinokineospora sp. NBRC 105648]|uniref:cadmium resistance transporter n=1 Tax=Actinokineospora sp. NBRC 105648 TaxID=3032206 RepID=UPI00249FD2C0|nr:cadmium resistance transporter [Actinokineospora sp. NBRC 105648]GLZ37359.1 cadmium transporter [Actinokineospora sp. NBRC 105648]